MNAKAVRNYHDFLWAMTLKEFKARYKQAVFGFLWVFLNPLFQMFVIGSIFSFFITIPNYFLFLFSGLLPWQFFMLSLSKAVPSFVNERSLLQKTKFPSESIPLAIINANLINLLASLLLLSIYIIAVKGIIPNFGLMAIAVIWIGVFTAGFSLLAASLNVRYRDVNFIVQAGLTVWFYATPILYSLNQVPASISFMFYINPLTAPFDLFHQSFAAAPGFSLEGYLYNAAGTLAVILLGVATFRKESRYFVDWL